MTAVKTLPTHEIVRRAYPRPLTERDELGMAVGTAIDRALSRYSREAALHRRPTAAAMNRLASTVLDEELADADLRLGADQRTPILAQIAGVLQAFRRSELFGLPRPRTRLILINGEVGVYAQPDYWDGRARFYEMKSYRAVPVPPHVRLQLDLFQLAFPGVNGFLVCIDRHASPVQTTTLALPPLTDETAKPVLSVAYETGLAHGAEKVLEFIDNPIVRYTVRAGPGSTDP